MPNCTNSSCACTSCPNKVPGTKAYPSGYVPRLGDRVTATYPGMKPMTGTVVEGEVSFNEEAISFQPDPTYAVYLDKHGYDIDNPMFTSVALDIAPLP